MAFYCGKKLAKLLKRITSRHHGNSYCLNCLLSLATTARFESYKKLCENEGFCNIVHLFEDIKILEFNQYHKSDKTPFIIYADLKCLMEEIDGCKNNPENLYTTKVNEHIPSGFSMSTIS